MNLEVLNRPFEASQISQREGRGGKVFDYVETHLVIARLNEAFEGEWTFRVLDRIVSEEEVVVLGELTAEGETKQQWGSKEVLKNSTLGDNLKAATSDSLKKCATLFGVALHLYADDVTGSRQTETNGSGSGGHLTEAQRKLREKRRERQAA